MRQNQDKVITGLGITLVFGGVITMSLGTAAVSLGWPIAAQMVGEMATTDLMILYGSITASVGGLIVGIRQYPWMLMAAVLWSIAFNVMVSKLGTAILYTSDYEQAITWFFLNFCLTAAVLVLSDYMSQREFKIVFQNDAKYKDVQPVSIKAPTSITDIAFCSLAVGAIAAIAATALPKLIEDYIRETNLAIIVNTTMTLFLAEVLVACAAIKDYYSSPTEILVRE